MKKILIACAIALLVTGNSYAAKPMRFQAQLAGFNAGGQPVNTAATGHARVEVIDDGTALEFRVNVTGINNLLMAHIHIFPGPDPVSLLGPAGPPVYWFNGGPNPESILTETVNGRLAQGYIITDDEVAGGTIQDLISAMSEGRASVIVHTDDLNPDTPTGNAGDSRAGELRGTLE